MVQRPSSPAFSGTFGLQYAVIDTLETRLASITFEGRCLDTEELVAIKVEPLTKRASLRHESRVYERLHAEGGTVGIPKLRKYGHQGCFSYLVTDTLGPSLQTVVDLSGVWTARNARVVAGKVLRGLESIHGRGLVHCDVRPANIYRGPEEQKNEFYLGGLGMSQSVSSNSLPSSPPRRRKSLVGCPCFASIDSHLGLESFYRSDLESLGYTLVYLVKGSLPWQGQPKNDPLHSAVGDLKMSTSIAELCEGLPECFATFLRTVRAMRIADTPDYAALVQLFLGDSGVEDGRDLCFTPSDFGLSEEDEEERQD